MFQKTLAVSDYYFGAPDWEYPLGLIQMCATSHGEQIRGEALPAVLSWLPEMPFDKMAEHSIDFWLQSEDLPRPENRIRYDGDRVVLDDPARQHGGRARGCAPSWRRCSTPMGAWPQLIERSLYLGKDIPIGGTAHQAGTCRFGTDPATLGARPRLQGARARQSLRHRCQLLPLDRRGESDADHHRQRAAGGRPDQGAARRMRSSTVSCCRRRRPCAARTPRRIAFQAQRILRISRVVSDLDRAEAFYRDALGFRTVSRGRADRASLAALGRPTRGRRGGDAARRPGRSRWCGSLWPGRPYPADSRSNDLWFQHSGHRRRRHGRRLSRICRAQRGWRADQRGRAAVAAAANGSRAGLQVPRSGRASAGADLVSARQRPLGLATDADDGAIPGHRPQRALSVASTLRSLASTARSGCHGDARGRSIAARRRRGSTGCPMRGCG